jgi:hypothetical protein
MAGTVIAHPVRGGRAASLSCAAYDRSNAAVSPGHANALVTPSGIHVAQTLAIAQHDLAGAGKSEHAFAMKL